MYIFNNNTRPYTIHGEMCVHLIPFVFASREFLPMSCVTVSTIWLLCIFLRFVNMCANVSVYRYRGIALANRTSTKKAIECTCTYLYLCVCIAVMAIALATHDLEDWRWFCSFLLTFVSVVVVALQILQTTGNITHIWNVGFFFHHTKTSTTSSTCTWMHLLKRENNANYVKIVVVVL